MFSRAVRPPRLVPAGHRLGPRLVEGLRPAREQRVEIITLTVLTGPIARQAGEPGFEPGFTVLETVRIAVNSLPPGGSTGPNGNRPLSVQPFRGAPPG